jgi:hypothetical protein
LFLAVLLASADNCLRLASHARRKADFDLVAARAIRSVKHGASFIAEWDRAGRAVTFVVGVRLGLLFDDAGKGDVIMGHLGDPVMLLNCHLLNYWDNIM